MRLSAAARRLALTVTALVVAFSVAIAIVLLQPWASNTPANSVGPSVGEFAPDFTIVDVNGTKWSLSGHRGQVVLLDFMGSNCATCIAEMRDAVLQTVHARYASQGFAMISIDIGAILGTEDPAEAWRFIHGLSPYGSWEPGDWPVALDNQGIAGTYRVAGLPLKYLIDPEGRIVWKWTGPVALAELDARVHSELG